LERGHWQLSGANYVWMAPETIQPGNALGPQCRDDAGGPPAPIVPGKDGLIQPEGVGEIGEVVAEHRLLARARPLGIEKPRRPIAAQIRHQHAPFCGSEAWRDGVIGVHVVGKTVEQD
jgi:hypothetical protein